MEKIRVEATVGTEQKDKRINRGKALSQSAFCYCDGHHNDKQLGEERVCFSSQFIVHHTGKSEQELKAGTEAEAWRSAVYWLAPMAWNPLSFFSTFFSPTPSPQSFSV